MKNDLSFLVVDDDPDTLRTMQALLDSLGAAHVHAAESAESALQILEKWTFDIILSDYQMEGMNGVVFTERLRERGDSTPVLLISGAPDKWRVLQALQQPGVDFFGKPFKIVALQNAVDRLLAA